MFDPGEESEAHGAIDNIMRGEVKVGVPGSLLALQDMDWDDNEWCGMEEAETLCQAPTTWEERLSKTPLRGGEVVCTVPSCEGERVCSAPTIRGKRKRCCGPDWSYNEGDETGQVEPMSQSPPQSSGRWSERTDSILCDGREEEVCPAPPNEKKRKRKSSHYSSKVTNVRK